MIQSTFVNPLRFCIGISMEWISGFKHEREVLLYNQFLPIQRTETFDDDIIVLVDHFMFSLRDRAAPISKKEMFYNQLGVHYSPEWIPNILQHNELFKMTQYGGLKVIDRMIGELDIHFFNIMEWIENAVVNADETALVLHDRIDIEQATFKDFKISKYLFSCTFNEEVTSDAQPLQFDGFETFAIPYKSHVDGKANSLALNVICKAADDSFDWVPVRAMILPQYVHEAKDSLIISESVQIPKLTESRPCGGRLRIRSASDIIIKPETTVNGVGVNVDSQGGDVRLITRGTLTNKGNIICTGIGDAGGGVMYIVTDNFVNGGFMDCGTDGQIHIFCTEYVNNGVILPEPEVIKTKEFNQLQGDIRGNLPEDVPLSAVDLLMHYLLTQRRTIGAKWLYQQFGFYLEPSWYQHIVDHPLLFQTSAKEEDDGRYRVLDRLSHEMNINFFRYFRVVHEKLHINQGTGFLHVSKWDLYNFLDDEEEIYSLGVVQEKKFGGRLSKERIMILTSRGRLLFVKLMKMELVDNDVFTAHQIMEAEVMDENTLKMIINKNKKNVKKQYNCSGMTAGQWRVDLKTVSETLSNADETVGSDLEFKDDSLNLLKEYSLSTNKSSRYTADEISGFEIPMVFDEIAPIDVYANPVDHSFSAIRIKTLLKQRFTNDVEEPVHIRNSIYIPPRDRQRGQGGLLEIRSISDIIIGKNVVITAPDCSLNIRGSAVRLISRGKVTNKGTLKCSSVHIAAETFVNMGVLDCNANGRIHIIAREYRNYGEINPRPMVVKLPKMQLPKVSASQQREIEQDLMNSKTQRNSAKTILLLGTESSGKSDLLKSLGIMSNERNIEEQKEGPESTGDCCEIRRNCVAAMLTLLKKSQELYDADPAANGKCLVTMKDSIAETIQMIVNYGSESFSDVSDQQEVEELGLSLNSSIFSRLFS